MEKRDNPALNEKRKWQIALRRYVIDKKPSYEYAPYFGLDIKNFRAWIALQFSKNISWENFGTHWQLEHLIPVSFFDLKKDTDKFLCWNFLNLKVSALAEDKNHQANLLQAKKFFKTIFKETKLPVAEKFLEKIKLWEEETNLYIDEKIDFINKNKNHLKQIADFEKQEFELLNKGRTPNEVKSEICFIKKYVS